ncbi:MAG TPA: InaA protein, partial [Pseudomonas sp.]|nr:InaA protein [Pseudomonas sp.]
VSLEDWYQQSLSERFGPAVQERMLTAVGITLARIHQARWQHGCCYPKHIFLRVRGEGDAARVEVALLDLEKSRRRLRRSAAARHDLRQLKRHRQSMPEHDWQRLLTAHGTFSQMRCDVI